MHCIHMYQGFFSFSNVRAIASIACEHNRGLFWESICSQCGRITKITAASHGFKNWNTNKWLPTNLSLSVHISGQVYIYYV